MGFGVGDPAIKEIRKEGRKEGKCPRTNIVESREHKMVVRGGFSLPYSVKKGKGEGLLVPVSIVLLILERKRGRKRTVSFSLNETKE